MGREDGKTEKDHLLPSGIVRSVYPWSCAEPSPAVLGVHSIIREGISGQVWDEDASCRAYWTRSQHLLSQAQSDLMDSFSFSQIPFPDLPRLRDTWIGACSMLMWTSTAEPSLWGKGKGSCSGRSQILRLPHFQLILWRPNPFLLKTEAISKPQGLPNPI